jgi:hypothetical protein
LGLVEVEVQPGIPSGLAIKPPVRVNLFLQIPVTALQHAPIKGSGTITGVEEKRSVRRVHVAAEAVHELGIVVVVADAGREDAQHITSTRSSGEIGADLDLVAQIEEKPPGLEDREEKVERALGLVSPGPEE